MNHPKEDFAKLMRVGHPTIDQKTGLVFMDILFKQKNQKARRLVFKMKPLTAVILSNNIKQLFDQELEEILGGDKNGS